MSSQSLGCKASKLLLVGLAAFLSAGAETLFLTRDVMPDGGSVAWYGSSTAFAGYYQWPDGRPPMGIYNSAKSDKTGYPLVAEADYPDITCNVAEDTCAIGDIALFGGLPDGTEIKFVTTGTLPGGLRSWRESPSQVYYIIQSVGRTFKLSLTRDGEAIALDDAAEGNGKHGLSFAGYSNLISLLATSTAKPAKADPGTDTVSTEDPHQLKDYDTVFVHSKGVLPSPLVGFEAGGYIRYCVEVVGVRDLKLRKAEPAVTCTATNPGEPVDITDIGSGDLYVYTLNFPSTNIISITGYPAGTVLSWRRSGNMLGSLTYSIQKNGGYGTLESFTIAMFAKIPAVTPAGDYPIRVFASENRASNKNSATFDYTLHVVGITETPKRDPQSYPEIPGLSSSVIPGKPHRYWENMMISDKNGGGGSQGGWGTGVQHNRCANKEDPANPWGFIPPLNVVPYVISYNSPSNAQVWFYNDESFFEIARYTGNQAWANCGLAVASMMRDKFLGPLGATAVQGYFYFPWTMVAAYRWTGDPSYKEAIISIADGGNNFRGSSHDIAAREHAFAFERRLARREVTGEEDFNLGYFADSAIAMLYINAVGSPERTFNEPFILGLLMRPLIRWYMISHDERVPVVVKLTLDKFWNEWYNKTTHKMLYNAEPEGMRCSISCGKPTGTGLNNLVAPAFAWYWRLTGDDTYQKRGDDLFAYVWSDNDPYFAKEWSQGYYWSWDFVRWRKGQQPAY